MAPFEVMISESQERMCAIVRPEHWADVREVAERWGLPVAVIGRVTDDGDITVTSAGSELARIPASALTSDAIVHERVARAPEHRRAAPAPGAPTGPSDRLPERGMDPGAVLLALLGSPNLASRRPVFEQYDSTVGADTVVGPGHGAAVLRIKGTTRALVAATDGNQSVGAIDPYRGAAMSVAEATRNVSITGARPLGVTNCLNYGDPTRPEAFWQLSEGVRGLGDACRALGLPVTGGNVSLYNESPAGSIAPTPEIGVVGLLDDVSTLVGPAFAAEEDRILLVGEASSGLIGSAYAVLAGTTVEDGLPTLDLAREMAVQAFIREAIARASSPAPRTSRAAVLRSPLPRPRCGGSWVPRSAFRRPCRRPSSCSGKDRSRLIMTATPRHTPALMLLARQHGLPVEELGSVGGDRLRIQLVGTSATGASEERGSTIADVLDVPLSALRHAWDHGLSRALGWEEH
jgi:phosphoribosylformylglycinamidine synthase